MTELISATVNESHDKMQIVLLLLLTTAYSLMLQPRPQGLLPDDFQNGGSTGEDPGKGWNHVVQNLQKSWRFLSRDILRKAKTKWRRRGSKTPVKGRFNFVHEAAVAS